MRKLIMGCLSLIMTAAIAGCAAGVGPNGAGVVVGYSEVEARSV